MSRVARSVSRSSTAQLVIAGIAAVALLISFRAASAQEAAADQCLAFAQVPTMPLFWRASAQRANLRAYEVSLKYRGHSTFILESPQGVTVATDYNDYISIIPAPIIATMNLAHDTHHSMNPDPEIKHLLKGWNPTPGQAQIHDLSEKDVRVRNIPTNIRTFGDESAFVEYGNSIFVFEVSGLCIAHLGHLHHTLTVQQLAQVGQMDVVLVPIDGSFTLDIPGMLDVLEALKAPVIVPMHYFSEFTLARFIEAAQKIFAVKRMTTSDIVLARDRMPAQSEVWVLPPG
ncbi:MAG: MBL fold metallo-hydrolase [Hyphomicrobiaceae bacterium]